MTEQRLDESGWPTDQTTEGDAIDELPPTAEDDEPGEGPEDDPDQPRRLVEVLQGGPLTAYQAPGSTLGPYVVEAEIARGGMGAVYRARHRELDDRVVALKVLLAGVGASPKQRKRFLREATVGASLLHPGLVRVHDYGEEEGLPWLALEYVEGVTLRHRMLEMPVRELIATSAQVCRALEVAHAANVVHRDLKPANILLREDGTPALTDFGLARDLTASSSITRDGAALGTPYYMSPEQTRGKKPTPATDVFSMAVILYQGLTGELPFEGESVTELYNAINLKDPIKPSQRSERAPELLDGVILKALEKDLDLRYTHAGELADDLEAYLEGRLEPIRRPRRWPRRTLYVAAAVALALLAGVAAAVFAPSGETSSRPPELPPLPKAPPVALKPARPWQPRLLPPATDPLPLREEVKAGDDELLEGEGWAWSSGSSLAQARDRVKLLGARGLTAARIQVRGTQRRGPMFSIVWRQAPPGTFQTELGLTHPEYTQRTSALAKQGRHPVCIETYGVHPRERYAVTWIKDEVKRRTRVRLTPAQLREANQKLAAAGLRVQTLSATRGREVRFAAVWTPARAKVPLALGLPARSFNALSRLQATRGRRLSTLLFYEGPRRHPLMAGAWRADGRDALTFFGQSRAEHAFLARCLIAGGYVPESIGVVGVHRTVYAAWVRARRRNWRASGPARPGLAQVDALVRALMERHDIAAGALALTRGDRLVLARGYTFGPPQQTPTQPRSLFRIGALSVPLTAVAILRLVESGELKLDQQLGSLFPELRRVGDEGAWDKRIRRITIAQLLQHRGGWDRHMESGRYDKPRGYQLFDPTFGTDRQVCAALGKKPPLTPEMVMTFVRTQPMEFDPGARHAFSNIGYLILGRVIERVSGRGYAEFMKKEVFAPLSASDYRIGGSRLIERAPGEVLYQGHTLSMPVLGPTYRQSPFQYGGWNVTASAAHGGWITSAVDLARFVCAFHDPKSSPLLKAKTINTMFTRQKDAAYGMGWHLHGAPASPRASHSSSLPGTWAHMERAPDGTGLVFLFSKNAVDATFLEELRAALKKVTAWPSDDLFQ